MGRARFVSIKKSLREKTDVHVHEMFLRGPYSVDMDKKMFMVSENIYRNPRMFVWTMRCLHVPKNKFIYVDPCL